MFLTGEVWKWVNCPIGKKKKKKDNFRGFASSAVSLIRVFDVFS